jgi:adenylate cyclase class IV
MARNIEIKARIDSVEALLPRARALADGDAVPIEQDDTFYRAPHGRLKLRRFADGSAELIHYHRPDGPEARASDYVRVPAVDFDGLAAALERALGSGGRVRKRRLLLHAGQTRVHLDRVEGLGDFIELEVVLREGQPDDEGRAIAERLMDALGLQHAERVPGAYLDLLGPTPDAR